MKLETIEDIKKAASLDRYGLLMITHRIDGGRGDIRLSLAENATSFDMPKGLKTVIPMKLKSDVSFDEIKKFIRSKYQKTLMAGLYDEDGNIVFRDIVSKGNYRIALLMEDQNE